MVQMKAAWAKDVGSPGISLYIPHGSDERGTFAPVGYGVFRNFISHMVQMKVSNR